MKLVAKYRFYRRCLQILLAVNAFFVCAGAVAFVHYLKSGGVDALELALMGLGTFLFGIVVPAVAIARLTKAMDAMRRQTEEAVARWVAGWMENYKRHDDEPMRDPYFWLNIALMSAEVFGENAKHPAFKMISEIAPLLKRELQSPKKKSLRPRAKSGS